MLVRATPPRRSAIVITGRAKRRLSVANGRRGHCECERSVGRTTEPRGLAERAVAHGHPDHRADGGRRRTTSIVVSNALERGFSWWPTPRIYTARRGGRCPCAIALPSGAPGRHVGRPKAPGRTCHRDPRPRVHESAFRAHSSMRWSRNLRSASFRASRRASSKWLSGGLRSTTSELELAEHGRIEGVGGEAARRPRSRRTASSPLAGPCVLRDRHARFSATTGDGRILIKTS